MSCHILHIISNTLMPIGCIRIGPPQLAHSGRNPRRRGLLGVRKKVHEKMIRLSSQASTHCCHSCTKRMRQPATGTCAFAFAALNDIPSVPPARFVTCPSRLPMFIFCAWLLTTFLACARCAVTAAGGPGAGAACRPRGRVVVEGARLSKSGQCCGPSRRRQSGKGIGVRGKKSEESGGHRPHGREILRFGPFTGALRCFSFPSITLYPATLSFSPQGHACPPQTSGATEQ